MYIKSNFKFSLTCIYNLKTSNNNFYFSFNNKGSRGQEHRFKEGKGKDDKAMSGARILEKAGGESKGQNVQQSNY